MKKTVRRSCLLALAIAAVAAAGGDPFVGTWKLDVAKSKFKPGPPLVSETVTIDPGGKVTVNEVNGAGEAIDWSYTPTAGSEVPIEGMPNSSVVEKRPSGTVIDHSWKMNGSSLTGHGALSKGGKTMTYTLKGVNAKGETIENVLVFVKQ